MTLARKVDVMNKKPGVKSSGGEKETVILDSETESWWSKFYKNDKKRVWLIVLATVTIIIANIFLPKEVAEKTTENPYFWAGVVALFGVHIIWGVFAPGKEMGRLEMAILYGIILFYGLTLVFPDDIVTIRDSGWGITKKVVAGIATGAKSLNEDYGKTPAAVQATTEVASSSGISTVPLVVPVGVTVEVNRPNGHYLASVNCPKDVVMEVMDMDTGRIVIFTDPATGISTPYQDCDATVRNGNLPLNIKLAFFQKGDDGGPVDVLVRWKKIV